MMSWIVWLLLSNVCIAYIEYTYRAGQYTSFLAALPYIALPVLLSQLGLFKGFHAAPSLFVAGAVFSLINVLFRVVNVFILGEAMNYWNWLGVLCMATSVVLLKIK